MIIGLIGKIGCGKSTIAKYFIENEFVEYTFATPIKDIAKIFGFSHKQVYGSQQDKLEINEDWGVSGREFLQKFGTDICRNFFPTVFPVLKNPIWVSIFESLIKNNPDTNYVISDIRFPDELESIKRKGGIIIKIVRPDYDNSGEECQHSSETHIEKLRYDFEIYNNETIEELYRRLDECYDEILK